MKHNDWMFATVADRYQLQLREAAPEMPQQRLWNRANAIRQYALGQRPASDSYTGQSPHKH